MLMELPCGGGACMQGCIEVLELLREPAALTARLLVVLLGWVQ